ncbi:MAG: KpsF/GutQ family sugar-phosphate isomerase [Lentisphaerae bacterium]|nr:KpsF/GutQ family sugar-phosphate isomerase [Lentisphaerota bacterium]
MNYVELGREVIDIEIEGLRGVRDALDAGFGETVRLALNCMQRKGKIVITGVGKNLHIARKASATLASTGATSVVLDPVQAMHGDLGILSAGDLLLALSYSGESEELLGILPIVKRQGIKVVAVTGAADNALAASSDAVIIAAVPREACPFNMAPTASTTAALAVCDALAMVLLRARGFGREDFAKLHPGGAIGRSLLLRVRDIMRTGERLAVLPRDRKVRDVLLAMTRSRSGSAGVVDDNGALIGIFTDGDLRRRLTDKGDLLDRPVEEVMTSSPVTVREDRLAVDVLRLFEEHNIDDLLVVDAAGRPVGAVDVQDLPKLKIV